jgi:hybrid cluster-associated redox disulfide protein
MAVCGCAKTGGSGCAIIKGERKLIAMDYEKILPDMLVADILQKWPQAVPVFISHQMACVGCSMSIFETLASAASIYQLPVLLLVEEISAKIEQNGEDL